MPDRATVLALAAALAACAAAAAAVPPAEAQRSSCSVAGRPMPGAGPLEWKRSRRSPVPMTGYPVLPTARTGDTFIFPGVSAIGGSPRKEWAAIDLRTLRPLPFAPDVPRRRRLTAVTASPTTVYIAHESFEDAPVGAKEIQAFDLRTGARLPAFDPPDFRDGLLGGMAFAGGNVVMGGAPPVGAGVTLGAYDATTGAPVWRLAGDYPVESLGAAGDRVFVEVPPETPGANMLTAFNAADGQPVPGWGATLPAQSYRTPVDSVDPSLVYTRVRGARRGAVDPFVVSTSDGSPRAFPRLPSSATHFGRGAGSTMLGQIQVRTPNGNIQVDAVFAASGKLIGTVCRRYTALAMSDARHVVAWEYVGRQLRRSRLVELVRPRG